MHGATISKNLSHFISSARNLRSGEKIFPLWIKEFNYQFVADLFG